MPSVAVLVLGQPKHQSSLLEVARKHGEVIPVGSPDALRALARDRRIAVAVVASVLDLGPALAINRTLADLNATNVRLVALDEIIDTDNCAVVLRVAAAVVEHQRLRHLERAREGRTRARDRGVQVGRPPRTFDEVRARELLSQNRGIREVARIVGVSAKCLRQRLMPRGLNA